MFVVQALSAYSTGEGAVATIVALCGGKTMMDTYNVVYDKVNPELTLYMS